MRLQQHMGRIAGARALTRKYEDDLAQARPPWQWAWKLPNARGALRHDERLLWRQEAGTERARMCRGWAGRGWAGPDGTNQPRPRQARPEQLEGLMRCDSQPHVCRLARSGATRCDAMRCDAMCPDSLWHWLMMFVCPLSRRQRADCRLHCMSEAQAHCYNPTHSRRGGRSPGRQQARRVCESWPPC